MAYRLHRKSPWNDEIKRVAAEQVDRALAELADEDGDRTEAIHQARKRCKKVRSALRLARGELDRGGVYRRENDCYRDIGHSLADLRDADALLECYDKLMPEDHARRGEFRDVRSWLLDRRRELADGAGDPAGRTAVARDLLERARQRIAGWPLHHAGFPVVAHGLREYYRRGRKALRRARRDPSDEKLHEWRKRVKDLWYHHRLLRDIWRPGMKARIAQGSELADLIGDDHDLALLAADLAEDRAARTLGAGLRRSFLELVRTRRDELQAAAFLLGRHLYVEKSEAFLARMRRHAELAIENRRPARSVPIAASTAGAPAAPAPVVLPAKGA